MLNIHTYNTPHKNETVPVNVSHQVVEGFVILAKDKIKYLRVLWETWKKQSRTLYETKSTQHNKDLDT